MTGPYSDKAFTRAIPKVYETYLVPLLFEPYAVDLARRLGSRRVTRVLEIAAGTGVVTRQLAATLPKDVSIVATDLNQAMLDQAAAAGTARPVEWRQADAMQLPFADGSFDAIVCQFGVMFFPDKPAAFAEARRVLRPGGVFLFNVWDRIEENELADIVQTTVASLFPTDPPGFLQRAPYGYFDRPTIERDVAKGGFGAPRIDTVAARSRAPSARGPAVGYVEGSPLRNGAVVRAMRASRILRFAVAVVTVAIVLIVGLAVGVQMNQRQQGVAAPSPTATASPRTTTAPSASATPTVTTTTIYNDDFGFVITGGDGPPHAVIRKESSRASNGTTQFAPEAFAVSADGKEVAFWAKYSATPELHLLSAGTGAERTLVTLTADQRAGGVAWSTDGAALLYSIDTGCGICGGPIGATLNIYELAASGRHGTVVDTQTNTGWYRPIAWDRSANLAAAGLLVEGGSMALYVTFRIDTGNTFTAHRVSSNAGTGKLGILMQSVRASTDAKFALGVDFESGDIKWWPLADVTASKSQVGAGKRGAQWRPGTHEIGFMGPSDQFWLGDVDKAGSLGLCCTAFSGAPAGSTLRTFRADGTAVLLGVGDANPFLANYTLVRFGGDPKSTSGDRVSFQDLSGVLASVRLR